MKRLIIALVIVTTGLLTYSYWENQQRQPKIDSSNQKVEADEITPTFIKDTMKIQRKTFEVCEVIRATKPLLEKEYSAALKTRIGGGIEAFRKTNETLIESRYHAFVHGLHLSYNDHRPLVLSPDMIWLLICQGFAKHVDKNSEQLRSKLVAFNEKKTITIQKNEFNKGNPDNDWESLLPQFGDSIKLYVGDELHSLILAEFTTSGVAERAAFGVTLMDALDSYFDYQVSSVCGIPEITLEGSPEDWAWILQHVESFRKYDLDWWIDGLKPVLQEFVNASNGKIDLQFWEQIYKWNDPGSGNPYITGWVINFFPYTIGQDFDYDDKTGKILTDNVIRRNEFIGKPYPESRIEAHNLPGGFSKADFKWLHYNDVFDMEFVAGFVGVCQDKSNLALRPEITWVVKEKQLNVIPRY